MRWDEVVEARERRLLRRLELVDVARRVIPVEFQLSGFARLRETIQQRALGLRGRHARAREFRRYSLGRWLWLVFLLLLAGFTVGLLRMGEWRGALTGATFSGLMAAWACSEVRSVTIGPRELVLRRLVGARSIPYGSIVRIDLVDAEREGVAAAVIVALRSGEEIKLEGFREGYLAVFDSLSDAWSRRGSLLRNCTLEPRLRAGVGTLLAFSRLPGASSGQSPRRRS
jgi:hypothetical protein